MGLRLCLTASIKRLVFLPLQFSIWPLRTSIVIFLLALGTFLLPFLVRQTHAIRSLDQIIFALLAMGCASSIWMSVGQAIGILPFLQILPMAGLLVRGDRGHQSFQRPRRQRPHRPNERRHRPRSGRGYLWDARQTLTPGNRRGL